ncbi:hypothetical protein HHX47_DHR5000901 [Lentinula edodes]|nr:hypothetical protein HHX47_DHR5000901 [Lentinula edodes]
MSSEKTPAILPSEYSPPLPARTFSRKTLTVLWLLLFVLWTYDRLLPLESWSTAKSQNVYVPANAQEILRKCNTLHTRPDPSTLSSFLQKRTVSDRYDPGMRNMSYLITNATIFTGVKDDDGNVQTLTGDLLMTNGIIRALGEDIPRDLVMEVDPRKLTVIRANGSWVTPGLVDVNSHLGIFSSPPLRGSDDLDSRKGPILPWLRSIDGLHTRDNAFELALAAGVTSAQILTGTSNSIGGQAFVIKLRRTTEGSALSMVVDPPYELNATGFGRENPSVWRHLLQSCSDETRRYGNRMDMMWSLRSAYHEARRVMKLQDAFCAKAEAGLWESGVDDFPENFQWEMLVDVLRGKVKTDQPVINSRELIDEARKAYHFGLTTDLALTSVTSTPSNALGLGYRMGVLQEGYDADVVMWDSHPLQLGATPVYVWIDGMKQIPLTKESGRSTYSTGTGPEEVVEPDKTRMEAPGQPSYEKERQDTVDWDGLPPLKGRGEGNRVVFRNVKEVWTRGRNSIDESFVADEDEFGIVVVEQGRIICAGSADDCIISGDERTVDVDLHGGSISPGLLTFGSPLGLEEIASEPSTTDGRLFNSLAVDIPSVFHDVGGIVRAVDALMFDSRHARMAYRFGVTAATSSLAKPHRLYESDDCMIWGLSTTFSTNAAHGLEPEAIIQTETALHVRITRPRFDVRGPAASVSTQIATLRRLLYGWESRDKDTGLYFRKAAEGVIPLVVEVHNADIMASLIMLRAEVDAKIGGQMRMVFVGATEAWLLAKELRSPLTNQTTLGILLDSGVVVGVGVNHPQLATETRFQLARAYHDSVSSATAREVYGLATINLEQLLGVKGIEPESADLVAFDGGSVFNLSSKIVAVVSPQRGLVDMM